jgi:hypothetical protein
VTSGHSSSAAAALAAPAAGIGFFEKWLCGRRLCILAGLALGNLAPVAFETLATWEYASVNLVVAVLIWATESVILSHPRRDPNERNSPQSCRSAQGDTLPH